MNLKINIQKTIIVNYFFVVFSFVVEPGKADTFLGDKQNYRIVYSYFYVLFFPFFV